MYECRFKNGPYVFICKHANLNFNPNKLYHSSTDLRWEISQNFEIYEVPIKSVTKALNNRTDCFIAPYSE